MRTYNVKFVSFINSVIAVCITVPIFCYGMYFSVPHLKSKSQILFGFYFLFLIFLLFLLWRKLVLGKTEWIINDKGFTVNWTQQFLFQNNKSLDFKWSEIEKIYQWTWDTNYYDLIIKFTSGKKIRFYHSYLTKKDDFDAFTKDLYQTFNEQKQNSAK